MIRGLQQGQMPGASQATDATDFSELTASFKIATGVMTSAQLPLELIRVNCLSGKNPSRMTPTQAQTFLTCRLGG